VAFGENCVVLLRVCETLDVFVFDA
jgi:hypothetical protein